MYPAREAAQAAASPIPGPSRLGRSAPTWPILLLLAAVAGLLPSRSGAAEGRARRVLYNLDGDSCMTLTAGRRGPGPVGTNELHRLIDEITQPGSQVDTLLLCVNAQVMYYPTRVGTLRGSLSTPEERQGWSAHERQRFANLQTFHQRGDDPYPFLFAEARRRGLETLLTFRMNDDHGNDFLRTAFWQNHPEYRLGSGALDFTHDAVREYVFRLIEEAVHRYDTDGLELDFQRFPAFFSDRGPDSPEQRQARITALVRRIRAMLDDLGRQRGRRLILAARVPSDYGRSAPAYESSLRIGCDPVAWRKAGALDFLTVSEFLFVRYDLPIRPWKDLLPGLPIYGGIECAEGSRIDQCLGPAQYRRAARHLWQDGADGIYLFNFFTTREWPTNAFEPPFEVLRQLGSPLTLAAVPVGPWETNRPIATVRHEVYRTHPRPRAAAMTAVHAVGPGLERREWQAVESRDDVADDQQARWSRDNGRTWTDWIPQQPSSLVDYHGTAVWEGGWADTHDPASGRLVQAWLRQIQAGGQYHCFTYVRTSTDLGRTWSDPVPLRYESGPDFDPRQPASPAFLHRNEGYPGNNFAFLPDGTLIHVLAHANAPGDPRNDERIWRLGSVVFRGQWQADRQAYVWTPAARIEIAPELSARGLMEPETALLRDGRLLVVWRGSDTGWDGTRALSPGRKWFSVSADGGGTLTPVREWRYADGGPFYSPSSIHRMIRSRATGRLYWMGNICLDPPQGNLPRHPLVIAEVDEQAAALKRETVTVLADRRPSHGPSVQFSNFSVLENPQTHELELYLTTYGQEPDPADWATADSQRYVVTLRP